MIDTKKYCIIRENPKAKQDIVFLHGFTSNKIMQYPTALRYSDKYNVILCDARGHGNRKDDGEIWDWSGTINDLDELINLRKHDTILIGHSMGGTEALTLGSKNKYVKKVFAVSAVHDREILNDEKIVTHFKQNPLLKDKDEEYLYSEFDKKVDIVLPDHSNRCASKNKKKFYLIHAKNDTVVPFSQFEKNKSDLLGCLSEKDQDKNTMVYTDLPTSLELGHILPFYDERTFKFIQKHLND